MPLVPERGQGDDFLVGHGAADEGPAVDDGGAFPGIFLTVPTLSRQLNSLELRGLVVRTSYNEVPPHVKYRTSEIAFRVDDFDAFHALYEEMGCIVRENPRMGLHFITDPDGQWIEILPE